MDRAVGLADEILTAWAPVIERLDLIPSSKGRFEITLDDHLVFSKADLGRHAEPGEVSGLLEQKLGAAIPR